MREVFEKRAEIYFGSKTKEFLEELKKPATHGFFLNTLKGNKEDLLKLIDFGYQESGYSSESYYTNYDSIGKTKAYELGLIYPQDVESSLSFSLLEDLKVETIVDLCAAPGGKSINAINRFKNATIISNEVNHLRASILSSNLERMGIDRSIVISNDCDTLSNKLEGYADLVILDAPCSGEGMIRKYPEILDNYSEENVLELAHIQKGLLDNAYKICKSNGYILYSTCAYSLEEDENQILDFIKNKEVKLIPLNFKYNYSKLEGTIKLCPLNGSEGQYFCLLKKLGESNPNKLKYLKSAKNKIVEDFIKKNIDIKEYYLYANNENYYLSLEPMLDLGKGVIRNSIYLGELKKDRFEPAHNLYRSNSLKDKFKYQYDLSLEEYNNYIRGLEIKADLKDGYYLIKYQNYSLGYSKCAKGVLKNKYPKGLRQQ